MNLVFIIKNRDNTPFMVVSTTPEGSTFKPMTEAAKELAVMLRQEYGKTPITKPELVQTMDSSKIIEGPSPSGSAIEKKVASLVSLKSEIVETKNLPVLSISEVLLSEFSNAEFRNVLTFKASSFISDQTQSSLNFEIKGVRAIWDPSLAIPGTNRRGGFRCPVGTRYGGQITDRFGRSCGWGVARRIANQIADIGERLEQRDDGKRKRRLDRRNARMMRRLGGVPETGRIEGGLRGIAERLEGGVPATGRIEGGLRGIAERLEGAVKPKPRRVRGGEQREVNAPSARRPQNRRRDLIPETAPKPKQPKVNRSEEREDREFLKRVLNGHPDREEGPVWDDWIDVTKEDEPIIKRLVEKGFLRQVMNDTPAFPGMVDPGRAKYSLEVTTAGKAFLNGRNNPAPKPRPARRPAPAGQRPRVVPQKESVDVLTAREASDAGASEDFKPYVLRKYDEYAKRVREIREGGGNAGMLTRREWYAINKPNLRDAWKDAHGRSAPQNFEPPTPQARRPRNNRGRRKKATTAGAGRSATRKPTADDVPEPAPARPVRPRAPRAPRAQANAKMPDLGGAGWDAINQPDGSTKWKKGNWTIELLPVQDGKFRGLKATNSDDGIPAISQNYNGPQGQASLNRFLRDFENNALRVFRNDESPQSSPDTPTPPTAPRASRGNQQSPLRRFKREGNPHGVLPIDRSGGGMGKFKKTEDPRINSAEKAIEHVKNGGDLGKVPPKYMFDALLANSSTDATDLNSRFRSVAPDGGQIGFTQLFFLRGEDGKRTNQGWALKASRPADNLGELVGWNYLAALGILEDGAIADGRVPEVSQEVLDRLEPRNAQRIVNNVGKQFIVTPMVFNDIPNDHKIGDAVRGRDFILDQLQQAPDRGLPGRLSNLLTSFVLGVSDRHSGNAMGRIVELPDGTKKVIVVPMDLGWSGQYHGQTFSQYQNMFHMDGQLVSREAAIELQQITDRNLRKKTYQEMIKTFDEIEAKTAQVINSGRDEFIKDALKNQSPTAATKLRAGDLFDGMAANLIALRLQRQKIVDLLPAGER